MSTAPRQRTPLRPARGPFAALKASAADLVEGEIVYAEDLRALFMLEDPAISGGSLGTPRGLVPVGSAAAITPTPVTRLIFVGDMSAPGNAPASPREGDVAMSSGAEGSLVANDWGAAAGFSAAAGALFVFFGGAWLSAGTSAPGGGGGGAGEVVSVSAAPPLVAGGSATHVTLSLPMAGPNTDGAMSGADWEHLYRLDPDARAQVQSDWNQESSSEPSHVRNRPGLVTQAVRGFMSPQDKAKLDAMAQTAQVQANWLENDTNAAAHIRNRPGVATATVNGFVRPDNATLSVNAQGVLSIAGSVLRYMGPADVTVAPPGGTPLRGAVFRAQAEAVCSAAWSGLGGIRVVESALLIFDGTLWSTADRAVNGLGGLSVAPGGALTLTTQGNGTVVLGVNNATNQAAGVIRIATALEAAGGSLNNVAVTPSQLSDAVGQATGGGITQLIGIDGISVTGTGPSRTVKGVYLGRDGVAVNGDVISGDYVGADGIDITDGTIRANLRSLTVAASQSFLTLAGPFNGAVDRTLGINAASTGTNNLVARNASGNFTAGTITAALNGNAATATRATSADRLTTPRTINGVAFDGTANIDLPPQALPPLSAGAHLSGQPFNGTQATTWAVLAEAGNVGNRIVARDNAGNFSAGTITAALNGRASTAGRADSAASADTTAFATRASMADQLAQARRINGVFFDGTANIAVGAPPVGVRLGPGSGLTLATAHLGGAIITNAGSVNIGAGLPDHGIYWVHNEDQLTATRLIASGGVTLFKAGVVGNVAEVAVPPRCIAEIICTNTNTYTVVIHGGSSTGMKLYAACRFVGESGGLGRPFEFRSREFTGMATAVTGFHEPGFNHQPGSLRVTVEFSSPMPEDGFITYDGMGSDLPPGMWPEWASDRRSLIFGMLTNQPQAVSSSFLIVAP